MSPSGFELTIPASARPQTHTLDRAATGTGHSFNICGLTLSTPPNFIFMISGFRCGIDEICALLGYYVASCVVILYRRFGRAYRSHLQRLRSLPLNLGPIRCPETSVKDYRSTLRNTPEERRSDLYIVSIQS
jgi:hypothetical protein